MYEVCQCIANVADFCRCIHYRFLFCLFLPSFDININDDILQLSNFPAMELFILKNTGSWAFTQHIFFWWSSTAVWLRASVRAVGDFDRARVSTRYSRKRGMRKQTAFSVLSCNCPHVSACVRVCVAFVCFSPSQYLDFQLHPLLKSLHTNVSTIGINGPFFDNISIWLSWLYFIEAACDLTNKINIGNSIGFHLSKWNIRGYLLIIFLFVVVVDLFVFMCAFFSLSCSLSLDVTIFFFQSCVCFVIVVHTFSQCLLSLHWCEYTLFSLVCVTVCYRLS